MAVIIPTLNEAAGISHTLAHTAALGFDDLIVVDGGSHDGTAAIVERLMERASAAQPSAPRLHLLNAPAGRARQLNVGAAVAQSDLLLFLHADTQLPLDAKALICAALRDPRIVGGRFDVRFDSDRPIARLIAGLMNLRSRWSGIATGDQAIFVRRTRFHQLAGWAEIPLMEDIEFSRRLKRAGRLAALRTPVITAFRRWERQGPLRTILLMWSLRFLYWIGVSPDRLQHYYRVVR